MNKRKYGGRFAEITRGQIKIQC